MYFTKTKRYVLYDSFRFERDENIFFFKPGYRGWCHIRNLTYLTPNY